MRARFAFGVSMAVDFDVYLVDEVAAVGDANFRSKCLKAFRERRDRSSIVMVSHNVVAVKRYCDIASVLHNGKLTVYDSVDEAAEVYEKINEA